MHVNGRVQKLGFFRRQWEGVPWTAVFRSIAADATERVEAVLIWEVVPGP
jgi:hypothetical protein